MEWVAFRGSSVVKESTVSNSKAQLFKAQLVSGELAFKTGSGIPIEKHFTRPPDLVKGGNKDETLNPQPYRVKGNGGDSEGQSEDRGGLCKMDDDMGDASQDDATASNFDVF